MDVGGGGGGAAGGKAQEEKDAGEAIDIDGEEDGLGE